VTALHQKAATVQQLQREILSLQGGAVRSGGHIRAGLGKLEDAFPQGIFPTAAIHEFLSNGYASAAATSGFLAGLLQKFIGGDAPCIWVSTQRTIYPPALAAFGVAPERIVFVDAASERDALWATEEALKCAGLAAVVCEVSELSFTASRRLQLAVEDSRVTGFIHRCNPRQVGTNACVARWRITPVESVPEDGLPGVGHPRWSVELQKIRNGRPGAWHLEWTGKDFRHVPVAALSAAASPAVPQKQKAA